MFVLDENLSVDQQQWLRKFRFLGVEVPAPAST